MDEHRRYVGLRNFRRNLSLLQCGDPLQTQTAILDGQYGIAVFNLKRLLVLVIALLVLVHALLVLVLVSAWLLPC